MLQLVSYEMPLVEYALNLDYTIFMFDMYMTIQFFVDGSVFFNFICSSDCKMLASCGFFSTCVFLFVSVVLSLRVLFTL